MIRHLRLRQVQKLVQVWYVDVSAFRINEDRIYIDAGTDYYETQCIEQNTYFKNRCIVDR